MRKAVSTFTALGLMFLCSSPALGWGNRGHRTVGRVAQLHLEGTNTLTRISQILEPGETLESVANWADTVKDADRFRPNAQHPDADTRHFFRDGRNRNNRVWHFVDLPLGCASYDACPAFTESSDIVHMIRLCVRRLRGENIPQLTTRNALRMLVHLVGDLHQPLHVGVGFVDENGPGNSIVIVRAPATILDNELPNDRGGNRLRISGATSNNLHSFWDADMVDLAMGSQSVLAFSQTLKNDIAPEPSWNGQGDFRTWAAQWASDSLRVSATNAYDNSIRITDLFFVDDDPHYVTERGSNYAQNNAPVVRRQLAKGGFRLARLLQRILP